MRLWTGPSQPFLLESLRRLGSVPSFLILKSFIQKRIVYCSGAIALLLVTGWGTYHFYRQHAERNGPTAIKNLIQINKLQADVSHLEATISSNAELSTQEMAGINEKLSEIHREISDLSDRTGLASNESLQKIQTSLEVSDATLNQKLLALGSEIQAIKTQLNPPKTLLQEALSFVVISVDLWNGLPYAQVEQKSDRSKVSYVGLNQSLGAWEVTEISAPLQSVTFVNPENQLVHVQVKNF